MPAALDPGLGHETILIVSSRVPGSTLVEQILASHPQVAGANEIKDLPNVVDAETRRRGMAFPLWGPMRARKTGSASAMNTLRAPSVGAKTRPRFTDKNLMNWYLVGAALAMLPAARVVIVWRDPLETCLACFRQCFTGDVGFACDLDELADYCIDFLRLKRFWLEKYPTRVFDLHTKRWWPTRKT